MKEAVMVSKTDFERRNRLAYLALYYAILGKQDRSEKIRRLMRGLEDRALPEDEPFCRESTATQISF